MNCLHMLSETRLAAKSGAAYITGEGFGSAANKFHMAIPIMSFHKSLAAHVARVLSFTVAMNRPLVLVQVAALPKRPPTKFTREGSLVCASG